MKLQCLWPICFLTANNRIWTRYVIIRIFILNYMKPTKKKQYNSSWNIVNHLVFKININLTSVIFDVILDYKRSWFNSALKIMRFWGSNSGCSVKCRRYSKYGILKIEVMLFFYCKCHILMLQYRHFTYLWIVKILDKIKTHTLAQGDRSKTHNALFECERMPWSFIRQTAITV